AGAKIAADAQGRAIRENLQAFDALALAEDFGFLFADLSQIVHKPAEDFAATVRARILQHKAAEERKAREKAEAEARAAEQRRQAEELAAQRAESARLEALAAENRARLAAQVTGEQHPQQVLKAEPATADTTDRGAAANVSPRGGAMGAGQAAAAAPKADEPATLTLGMICLRLGFTVRAEFVADVLNVKPAAMPVKGRGLYTERQFALICAQLVSYVSAMAELHAGETV
ncbi:MAG: hypothetical protein ACRCUE_08135, partial [Bosea sp. (in: a-proteobacteria)]